MVSVETTELCYLAEKYRTDKCPAIFHNYTPYYHELLKDKRESVKNVLEIGIGAVGEMAVEHYQTGASLFMWRDYFPSADIYAVDFNINSIDELSGKDRIKTFYCDQSNMESLWDTANRFLEFQVAFDLIIDDGSHLPYDQIKTWMVFQNLLAPGGIYIVEDVMWPAKTMEGLPTTSELVDFGKDDTDRVIVIKT